MLLGIDVGGTHTDAVIIDRGKIVAQAKVETCQDNLIVSLDKVLDEILKPELNKSIDRINLSTTLTTNAIIEDKLEEVGILAVSGPGLAPDTFNHNLGNHFYLLDGAIDHRGSRQQDLDEAELQKAVDRLDKEGVKVFAVAGKFSSRNPEFEDILAERAAPYADFVSIGHKISGQLNFPRRLATAYYNAAVWRRYNNFADAVTTSLEKFSLKAPLNILKADGGTIDFKSSRTSPVQTILSGPAASVMGIIALCTIHEDAVILDIGGTTTDIAIFAKGAPLLEKEGAGFAGRATSIRAIKTCSIGIGGDSLITINADGAIKVGPHRQGPPMAFTGKAPTLLDACNVKGLCALGDKEKSFSGLAELAAQSSLSTVELAGRILDLALENIHDKSMQMLDEINQKPAYTVAEIIHSQPIKPKKLFIMGGPARVLAPELEKIFDLETVVPENFAVANAVGAALTRPTMEIDLFADTGKQRMLIPALDFRKEINSSYSLEEAQTDIINTLKNSFQNQHFADDMLPEIEIISAEEFNMVDDYSISSKSIRVSCQLKPGLVTDYHKVL